MQCLKCGAERNLKDLQCPECGVFYAKAEAALLKNQELEIERLRKENLKLEAEQKKKSNELPEKLLNPNEKIEPKKVGYLQTFAISFVVLIVIIIVGGENSPKPTTSSQENTNSAEQLPA